ncbi:MAG: MiaB/RimO family radical SAM methylthiotransferase [Candidatus Absconditicoccaceae bacterium]
MFFSFINLGCTKNLVDTQFLLGRILERRPDQFFYAVDPFSDEVELVFLNTCGFISSGRQEMFHTMKKLLRKKKKICLLGCAVQYFEKLVKDARLSDAETQEWERLKSHPGLIFLSRSELANFEPSLLEKPLIAGGEQLFDGSDFQWQENARAYTNSELGFEYLKIAEGCNNHCSFCIIPTIRGKQRSLSLEVVIAEARNLIASGVRELILIAQDSTRYGVDLYGKSQLFELLEGIDALEGDFHYRVLYLYPDLLTKKHLERLTKLKKFIPYFDLPLQHASPKILKAMGRFYDHQMTLELLDFIEGHFLERFVRTNFIIGFPGETEEDFQVLMDFIRGDWFENIALFEYHDEPLAASSLLPDKVEAKTIRKRFLEAKKLVDELQAQRSQHAAKEKTGTISELRSDTQGNWRLMVRPFLHCPEIDEEDEIQVEQVMQCFDGEELTLGSRVAYRLL